MRVFLTGGTGFIGGAVARQLRERGDDVVALVRTPAKAAVLSANGVELVAGDLGDVEVIRTGVNGCDAVIHAAAIYEVGVPKSKRSEMYDTNVEGTRRVLEAALTAGVTKAVYVSTVGIFGNTHGQIVDETYQHPRTSYTSYYEETKLEAHDIALELAGRGLPVVIVQPGGVYGPGDPSALGENLAKIARGKLPFLPFPDLGMTMVHRDDVAGGVVLALDKGRSGESYILTGDAVTVRDLSERIASLAGRRGPRGDMPTWMIRAVAPLGPVIGPMMGLPPNFHELISTSEGVTFWARADKARAELGFVPRSLEDGLTELVATMRDG
ncbi:MAG: NAD-dependent epimerase/dehydratase family protein [Actinomycetes bacterium]